VLLYAWDNDRFLWVIGTIVAFMTALYMFRAIFMTFFGEYRGGAEPPEDHGVVHPSPGSEDRHGEHGSPDDHATTPHESPRSMLFPLVMLSIPAILFGLIAPTGVFGELVEGALLPEMRHFEFHAEMIVVASSTVAALAGIAVAAAIYYAQRPSSARIRAAIRPVHTLVDRLYYVNEFAEDVVTRGALYNGICRVAAVIDRYVVDGAVNGAARVTSIAGDALRRTQTGQLQAYTSAYVLGAIVAAGIAIVLGGNLLDRLVP
jgi:NADH:ubiquinone oxidoreductase subunit 5 (subunit L)/multisubunit Na+/H+ antiporter MnhA subunit